MTMTLTRPLLSLLIVVPPLFGQRINLPPTTRQTLDNGLTVILMQYRKVPVVHFRMVVKGGSVLDPPGREGVAAMTASLMREGTDTRSAMEIANAIDFVGGSLSVAAGADYCAASAEILSKDAPGGLDLFSDVILHPSFPQSEIDRERKQRLANLEGLKEDPGSVASVTFRRNVYGTHPYGRQSFGTKASLDTITRGNLLDFYHKVFVPENATLVVVGDFVPEDMSVKIRTAFGGWKKGEKPAISVPPPSLLHERKVILVNKPDATQTQMVFGNIGIGISSPDYFAVRVANTIFGGGFTSRLVDELRVKRSLTYEIGSGFSANLFGGTYSIGTFTKNATVDQMIDGVLEEISKYRSGGATAQELEKAQNYLAGNFSRSLQSPESLASRITDVEIYGFPSDYLGTYIEKLKAVTLDDVRRVVRKYLQPDDLLIVLVAPGKEIVPGVQKYGPVSIVELDAAVQ